MKKTLFYIALFTIITASVSAQSFDWAERQKAFNSIDALVESYAKHASLIEPGQKVYSPEFEALFEALFVEECTIEDAVINEFSTTYNTDAPITNVRDYISELKNIYPQGMAITLTNYKADYTTLEAYEVRMVLARKFKGKIDDENTHRTKNNIVLDIRLNDDLDAAKIVSLSTNPIEIIAQVGDPIVVTTPSATTTNPPPLVVPEETAKNEVKSDTTSSNKKQLRGLYLSPILGFGTGTASIDNGSFGYGNDVSTSIEAAAPTTFGGGVEIDYFLNNTFGIGSGLSFERTSGAFTINSFEASYISNYYHEDIGDTDYLRTIIATNIEENYDLTNIGVPLLVKLRFLSQSKLNIQAHLGIRYNFISSLKASTSSGNIDYSLTFNTNSTGDAVPNFEQGDNMGMFYDAISDDRPALYNAGLNYGFGLSPEAATSSLSGHLALVGRLLIGYRITNKANLIMGASYTQSMYSITENTKPLDIVIGDYANRRGQYHSLINTAPSLAAYGLNLGIQFRLN